MPSKRVRRNKTNRRVVEITAEIPKIDAAPPPGMEATFKIVYRKTALHEQGGLCFFCWCPIARGEETADHLIPRKANGQTTRANIKAVCLDCNQAKGSMSPGRFQQLIRGPLPGSPMRIWRAHLRWKIGARLKLACKRIANWRKIETFR